MYYSTGPRKGIQIRLRISNLISEVLRDELLRLKEAYAGFNLCNFRTQSDEDLHVKMIMADRKHALIGSANFTKAGLAANHEIGVVLQGRAAERTPYLFSKPCRNKRATEVR